MAWIRMRFKKQKVYAEVDENGDLLIHNGRARIKYRLDDSRTYSPNAASLSPLPGSEGAEEGGRGDVSSLDASSSSADGVSAAMKDGATERSPGVVVEDPAADAEAGGREEKALGDEGILREPRPASSTRRGGLRLGADAHDGPPFLGTKAPIVIYTDGACSGNPGPAGIGVVMTCGSRRKEYKEYIGRATSNIAELTAVLRALRMVRDPERTVILHTDSAYALGVLGGWKAKANKSLIESIKQEMNRFPDLRLLKVKGHAGIDENERCDELAKDAVSSGGDE